MYPTYTIVTRYVSYISWQIGIGGEIEMLIKNRYHILMMIKSTSQLEYNSLAKI